MFEQAMQQALMSSVTSQGGQGGQDTQSGQSADSDLTSKVDRMREMGIVDEALAIQALQIMGGDLQAAVTRRPAAVTSLARPPTGSDLQWAVSS